ncbi:MAG TPA: molybdenum cofactor guanylyltransferase [Terriglobales bacterium]|nr:molybdenum cofactor guanylyltransferase [Terriglobales bacterium]
MITHSPNKQSASGFVLAGGKSSRLGADKAFAEIGGRTLLERGIEAMRSVCDEVAIVGDPAKFASYGPVVSDVYPNCGPLSGIHAALLGSTAELNLVIAVDMPLVTSALLAFLRGTASASDAVVVVPRTAKGFQPLCAVYRRSFAVPAEKALRAGKFKIDALFEEVPVRILEAEELATAGFAERLFFNVNTPDDLRAASSE